MDSLCWHRSVFLLQMVNPGVGRLFLPAFSAKHAMHQQLLVCCAHLFAVQVLWWDRDWWGLPGGLHVAAAGSISFFHSQPWLTARAAD
jgi:hypothetical protein